LLTEVKEAAIKKMHVASFLIAAFFVSKTKTTIQSLEHEEVMEQNETKSFPPQSLPAHSLFTRLSNLLLCSQSQYQRRNI